MKRSKRLLVLLGVLAVACAATLVVWRMEEEKEQIKVSGEVVLEIPADRVIALSWDYEDTDLAFHKDETWLYDGDEAFPVSEEAVEALLDQFSAFSAAFTIEEPEDLGQYGLSDPLCTIEIATEEETYEILLGDYSAMDSQRYVSTGDGNVYLAATDPLDAYDVTLEDMIQHDDTPYFDQISTIRFTGADDYEIFYEEDNTASAPSASPGRMTMRSSMTRTTPPPGGRRTCTSPSETGGTSPWTPLWWRTTSSPSPAWTSPTT